MTALSIALANMQSLKNLIVQTSMSDAGAVSLSYALAKMCSLEYFQMVLFDDSSFGGAGFASFSAVLPNVPSLISFDLSGDISDVSATVLSTALAKMSLENFGLISGRITDTGAVPLIAALANISSLKSLRLINNMSDAGATFLSGALEKLLALESFCLYSNDIGDVGAASLSSVLAKMSSLQSLGILGLRIGDTGAAALSVAIANMASLKSLIILGGNISDDGAGFLKSSFVKMSLETLYLCGFEITDAAAKDMASSLECFGSIGSSEDDFMDMISAMDETFELSGLLSGT